MTLHAGDTLVSPEGVTFVVDEIDDEGWVQLRPLGDEYEVVVVE